MPIINLTWKPFYVCNLQQASSAWISDVTWVRCDDGSNLPEDAGLYVIENGAGQRLYVGKAKNFLGRFQKRNRVLREFRLAYNTPQYENPVHSYSVRLAEVNPPDQVATAEGWLIRISYLDQLKTPPLLLQNINATTPFLIPSDGLTITNTNNPDLPSYLKPIYPNYAAANKSF